MPGQSARVFLVEDDPELRALFREYLEDLGHSVVAEAGSLGEALERIEDLGDLDANVALIDCHLGRHQEEGAEVEKHLAQRWHVRTISMSGYPVEPLWSQLHLLKGNRYTFSNLAVFVSGVLVPA